MTFLQVFIPLLFTLYSFMILARVLMSWMPIRPGNRIAQLIIEATDPLLKPLRNVIPPIGMMDISPIVALILLQVAETIIMEIIGR